MKHCNIEFKINEAEKIVIELEVPLDQIDCCYQEYMKYYVQDKLLCTFSLDTIRYYLEMLRSSIQKGLEDKIPLDPFISKDIGYLYNEDCQKNVKSDFTSPEWIGEKYAFIAGYWDEKNWFSS